MSSSSDGPECVCLGETMVMVTPAGAEPLESAESCLLRPGGAESNVAMYLVDLGHRAGWLGRVGDDALGRMLLRSVGASGVDVSLVERSATEPTGVYFKDPGPDGTRVLYYRRGSAAAAMDRSVLDPLTGHPPRVLHLSGITPALSDSCADLVEHVLRDRPLAGTTLTFDVNHRPGLWDAETAGPALLDLARLADVVFVGLDEAATLWGTDSAASVRSHLGERPMLVVKDAGEGATCFSADGVTQVPALRVEVVEPVGAGDAFAAGWLSAALRGRDHAARLRTAHLVASSALTSVADHAPGPAPEVLESALALDDAGWAGLYITGPDQAACAHAL